MDHLIYVDEKAEELRGLLGGQKTMIVRGADKPGSFHHHVQSGDRLFFISGKGLITACSVAGNVFQSEKLTESQSRKLLNANQSKLHLTPNQLRRWAGKRYLMLIDVKDTRLIEPFHINQAAFGIAGDLLPVGK